MKKVMTFLLLAAVLLAWTVPVTKAQHRSSSLTAPQANAILQKTVGTWQINSLIWQPWQNKFADSKGKASFYNDEDAHVRERLELVQPNGTIEETEGILRYSDQNKRFEFVQLDKMGNCTMIMFGEWNPNFNMITFTPAKGKQKHLDSKAYWQYFFFDDGSFKKVIRTPDGQGNYIIAAEFHCQPSKVAKLRY